jgi:hypothetical protein
MRVTILTSTLGCLVLFALPGCGGPKGPKLIPTTGTVSYNGKALSAARVQFLPIEGTEGVGGTGKTDAEGTYKISYRRGGEGLPAGKYKVVISKRVMPDGSEPSDDVPPIESPARETLPARFSSQEGSTLQATVSEGGNPIPFDLK